MGARSRVALALSGGGFTGYLFEIGALTALDDLFDDGFSINQLDFYVGVSAGSAAAALMANGVSPEEILQANLTSERPYYFERRDIFAPAVGEGFRSLARALQQLCPVFTFYVRHRREMGLIDVLEKAQEALPGGIYTLDPFARYLEGAFSAKGLSNRFDTLPGRLYIPAIDLQNGQSVIFGDDGWQHVPISKAVTASSAAPIYFCPVRIGDRHYIDAGVGRFVCFELAVKRAVEFMIIIHPCSEARGAGHSACPAVVSSKQSEYRGFLAIADQAARINHDARFSLAFDLHVRESANKFFVISPSASDPMIFDRSFLSFHDRIALLQCGYLSVVRLIKGDLARMRGIFAQHGVSISLTKMEERLSVRLKQLSLASETNRCRWAGAARPTGWSSAY